MTVGTEQGQVYKGKQGIQYATVLDSLKPTMALIELGRAGQRAKSADKEAGLKTTLEFKPEEVWHYYSAEANQRFENWAKKGAALMTQRQIPNLWNSTDPDAVNWQLEGAKLKAGYDNINQAKDLWDKSMQDIGTRGDKYEDSYLSSVKNFPSLLGYEQIASGQFNFPQAKFKDPSNIYAKFFTADANNFKNDLKGVPPTDAQLWERTAIYFSSPEHEADLKAAAQMYQNLTPEAQKVYQAKAELMGVEDAPHMALAFENYKAQFVDTPRNVMDDALGYAKAAPKSSYSTSKEDVSGVTKSSSATQLSNKNYPMDVAVSHFNEKAYLLDDEGYMASLGVDFKQPRADRYKAATAAFAQKVRENITRDTESGLARSGSGFSQEETDNNFDNWYNNLISKDKTLANEAANWLYGGTKAEQQGVVKAEVMELPAIALRGQPGASGVLPSGTRVKVIAVEFKSEAEAAKAREDRYNYSGADVAKMSKEDKEAYDNLMTGLKGQERGTRVFFPITKESIQVIKELHRNTAQQKKALYEKGYKDDMNAPGSTPQSTWSAPESGKPAAKGSLNAPPKQ